jgi:hypothetical protein
MNELKDPKGPSKKREHTAERIIAALNETRGFLTMAAPRAGVSYRTIKRYVHDFPTVKRAMEEAHESITDGAESALFDAIKEGNITAIIFYLKTQGKGRGYVEKSEIAGEVKTVIEVHYEDKEENK